MKAKQIAYLNSLDIRFGGSLGIGIPMTTSPCSAQKPEEIKSLASWEQKHQQYCDRIFKNNKEGQLHSLFSDL